MSNVQEKLQELILDENKVVTYKTLCRTVHVPANIAKQYLSDFFDKYAAEHDLFASYILIGLSPVNKVSKQCTRIALVSSHELEETKKGFSSISSMQVYAVYKGKLQDENILFNTDYEKMDRVEDYNKFSYIKNPNIYVQAEQQVKHVFIPTVIPVDTWKPNPPSNQTTQKNEIQRAPAAKSKSPNVFSMFQKKNEDQKNQPKIDTAQANDPHQKSPSKNKKPSPIQNKSSKGSSSTKNDVKYFFAKQSEKPPKIQAKKEEPVANQNASNVKEKEPSKTKEVKSSPEVNKSSSSRHSGKRAKSEKSKTSRSKAKRVNANDSDEDFAHVKKKHKRIVTMESDSESENEQEIDRAQRELFDSHPAAIAAAIYSDDEDIIPPTQPVANGKKKKWKVVTKTYEDEDGFFVTKKEKELVTDSDEGESEYPSKAPVKKRESPKASPTKKKQSSLMNFFKQK